MAPVQSGNLNAPEQPAPAFTFTRADAAALALLVASIVAMFWKVIFGGELFFYRDISNYTYPTTQFIHELCRQGILPYWNPYLNYGQPILANPNLLFFYPYTLLIVLLPFDLAFSLHFVVHFALAAVGTYLLARTWGQSYLAAFFAASVFVFSGPVLSLGNFYNTVACCAWIPWALLATHHALESKRLRAWVLLVVVFSLQWLAAEPLTMMATFGICFAYAIYRRGTAGRVWSWVNLRLLAAFFLVGCGMLLLCAVQLLPAVDMLSNSHRSNGLTFAETTMWSANPLALLEAAMPSFGSFLAAPPAWGWLVSDRNDPYNTSNFLGFVPLFFAFAGWAMGRDRRRTFLAGAAGILVLLSFGHYTPVFALARLLLPPLLVVRFPIKLLVHVVFLLAILAGWGFDALRNASLPWAASRRRVRVPLEVLLGCVVVVLGTAWVARPTIMSGLRWSLRQLGAFPYDLQPVPDYLIALLRFQLPGLAGFCLAAVILILGLEQGKKWARPVAYALAFLAIYQLATVNYDANPTVPKSFYTYQPPVLEELKGAPASYRFIAMRPTAQISDQSDLRTYLNFQSIPEARDLPESARSAFAARIQLYTGSMFYRVEGSINLDPERSVPPALYDVKIYIDRNKANPLPLHCMLGRLNVRYILRPTSADTSVTRPVADIFNGSPEASRLYEDLCFVPRTYVASNSLFLTSSDETLNRLALPEFDSTDTVIIAASSGSSPSVSGSGPAGQVEITHRGPDSVTMRAQLDRPGYIVLLDRFDPNWHAILDGRPVPVLRVNQLFRAVYADAGQHQLRYVYRQSGLLPGLVCSLCALVALVGLCFIGG